MKRPDPFTYPSQQLVVGTKVRIRPDLMSHPKSMTRSLWAGCEGEIVRVVHDGGPLPFRVRLNEHVAAGSQVETWFAEDEFTIV